MKWIDNRLADSKEIAIICYQLCLLSYGQERLDAKISRLKARSDFCGANHHNDYCEEYCLKEKKREVINIDYNFQLKKILNEFLRSNQGSFDGFEVECGNLVEKANECEKLVEMEIKHHAIGEEEKLKNKKNGMRRVNHVDLYVAFEAVSMDLTLRLMKQNVTNRSFQADLS
ncbi:unnamed protein product [Trifolium pratense]|uniref:Uncharacterized protein n=1 Tax=Trifolium pratense TaxID=57577 RepID=A0ACB0IQL6_TRIPR|nr:unnamed protein product [Trifolium pratense]